MTFRILITVLFALAAPVMLLAEEAEETAGETVEAVAAGDVRSTIQDEILVLATRLERTIEDTGATATVLTKEDFQARQTRQAGDVLRPVPGTFLASGTPGAATSAFIRGAASNQTVVVVDGVQVNDPTLGGQYNFYDLGILNFQSVEVLRGSASTLYGTDAAGGVVSYVTEQGRGDPRGRAQLETGSFGYYRAMVGALGEAGPVSFNLGAVRLSSENELEHDSFSADTFAGTVGYAPVPGLMVTLSGRYMDSEKEDPWDFPFGPQIEEDPNIRRDRRTTLGSLRIVHEVNETVSWSLSGWLFDVRSDLENGPDLPGDPMELESTNLGRVSNATGSVNLFFPEVTDWLDVTTIVGLELENEKSTSRVTTSYGPVPDVSMTLRNQAAFMLLELGMFERCTLSGGLRRDKNSFYGYQTTASASGVYHLETSDTRIRANYGQGFRGPRPVEFSDPYVGNPGLVPERSVSYDVGVEQGLFEGKLVLGVTWFDLSTRDLIAWDPSTGILENYARAKTDGFEFTLLARPLEGLEILGSLTAQDPRNQDAGPGEESRLPGRPTRFGGGEVRYRYGVLLLGAEVYASNDYPNSGRITPDGDSRHHPGRKLLIALRGRVDVTDQLAFTMRLENLLDDQWYDNELAPDGLGRGFYLGMEAEF